MDEVKTKKKKSIIIFALVVLAIIVGLLLYLNSGTENSNPEAEASLQTTDTVLMVSPVAFDYNEETAVNNAFQEEGDESEKRTVDLTHYEEEGIFLEGTGSMVLDRVNKIAYACESPRTNKTVLEDFCDQLGYSPVLFKAVDADGAKIYHTNVMMHVGSEVAVVCLGAIKDPDQRAEVRKSIEDSGKTIVEISFDQMNHFAGNMLELRNRDGNRA